MIIALNGSPRPNGNTAAMLRAALEGAASTGAETKLIQLYPLKGKGCVSCFSCKRKGGKLGHCALKDDFSPVLDMMEQADALLFGSPIYYYTLTPEMLALIHRFLFSHMLYNKEKRWVFPRVIPSAFIYTFGVKENAADELLARFSFIHNSMGNMLGRPAELLYSADAWQFSDYSLYEADRFDEAEKRRHLEEVFPLDKQKAFELGIRLAKAKN
ncbi:flavodoxin family protein [uncultured Mailhella sp.]|uniref:flavodoxin family protein n=1 Tax=uncultured Mailhella sp. TaxID=1981031 RepID=UPI0026302515|nr:flavodoxin family protein [uncultured Mailhella sp.]